ncbi:MAG TPA: response regulator [Ktedonobacterales bacterium]
MAQAHSGSLTAGPRTWRVLVVDDEENLNWSIVTSLRREQYAADGALTAEDARRRMVDIPYDCVISDIQMPGIDGFQLLSWVREQRPAPRVIMMTAFGSPSVRQEALRNGVSAYLEKPFDLGALKRELRKALETPAQAPATYDLIEITQVINLARRDVAVQAQVGDQMGMLVFERGELIFAQLGALRGEQAFFAMCANPAQQVTPAPAPERVERNVLQPLSTLIFDALLKRDTGLTAASPAAQSRLTSGPPPMARAPITASLVAVTSAQTSNVGGRDAQRTLAGLVSNIALPCAVALVRPDGTLMAQAQTCQPPVTEAVFIQLAQGFAGFVRAAQMGQLGAPREAWLTASGAQVLVRMIAQRPSAPVLVVVASADADTRRIDANIGIHDGELAEIAM